MKRIVVLLLAISLLLVSCSSLSDLVRAQVEGLPSWVYEPQTRSGQVAFVGKGVDPVPYNARLAAYEDIISQISAYVGQNIRPLYYRELTTTGAITDFKLTITNEFTKAEPRTPAQVYMLARMDEQLLSGKRTSLANEMLKRDADIDALIVEADKAYRANDDTKAIRFYLEAALLSAQGPVSQKKHELSYLLEKAQGFVEALRFTLKGQDSTQAKVTVSVQRKSRLLSPKVLNAKVSATFEARNSLGMQYTDSLQFNTASDGFFPFVPYNQGLLKTGVVTFTLDFSDLLARLSKGLPFGQRDAIVAALQACRIDFPYAFTSLVADRPAVAEIQQFNMDGQLQEGSDALETFSEEMALDAIPVQKIDLQALELEQQLQMIADNYPQAKLAFLGTVGIAVEDTVQQTSVTVLSGRVQLYEVATKKLVADTQEVQATGFGDSASVAREQAFKRFGRIAAYVAGSYLFNR